MTRSTKYIVILFFPILMFQCACDTTTEAPSKNFASLCQIHLQVGFSQTWVGVTIDNAKVFEGEISTIGILGYAAIIPVQVSQGTHKLNVGVFNSASKDTIFTVIDSLYIGVNYDATNAKISYIFQRHPFPYD